MKDQPLPSTPAPSRLLYTLREMVRADLPHEELLRRAAQREMRTYFRARVPWRGAHRPLWAREWSRVSDADEDESIGADPLFETVLPFPQARLVDLIGHAERQVIVSGIVLEGDDETFVELVRDGQPIRFKDLLVDEQGRSVLHAAEDAAPGRRPGDDTRVERTDLRILSDVVRLMAHYRKTILTTEKGIEVEAVVREVAEFLERTGEKPVADNTFRDRLRRALGKHAAPKKTE